MFEPNYVEIRLDWANRNLWHAGQSVTQNQISAHSLWVLERGALQVTARGETWRLNVGDALLWPASLAREVRALEETSWLSVGLRAMAFGHLDVLEKLDLPRAFQTKDDFLSRQMTALVQFRRPENAAEQLLADGLARTLVGACWQELEMGDLGEKIVENVPGWMPTIMRFLRENPSADVAEMTQAAALSPAHLRREFGRILGLSPHEFLLRHRRETARRLLETTDWPVRAIARHTGFRSASHFSAFFRAAFGVSPDAYRRYRGENL